MHNRPNYVYLSLIILYLFILLNYSSSKVLVVASVLHIYYIYNLRDHYTDDTTKIYFNNCVIIYRKNNF